MSFQQKLLGALWRLNGVNRFYDRFCVFWLLSCIIAMGMSFAFCLEAEYGGPLEKRIEIALQQNKIDKANKLLDCYKVECPQERFGKALYFQAEIQDKKGEHRQAAEAILTYIVHQKPLNKGLQYLRLRAAWQYEKAGMYSKAAAIYEGEFDGMNILKGWDSTIAYGLSEIYEKQGLFAKVDRIRNDDLKYWRLQEQKILKAMENDPCTVDEHGSRRFSSLEFDLIEASLRIAEREMNFKRYRSAETRLANLLKFMRGRDDGDGFRFHTCLVDLSKAEFAVGKIAEAECLANEAQQLWNKQNQCGIN
ncbi:MAG: hypothetical protein QG574_4317 [Cyanobacteriota bacterium erpe_2018_sw_21hr_WHONDRS-SW48-000092_B_bin.40]|jgi:tetratricopeptide (TPR) repeat protein|nr:hypothetical protein [Cyanobacteriota bacterium erpe_2018_sw_21hr_WHONDRS-SW48-000092_B_bin.40]